MRLTRKLDVPVINTHEISILAHFRLVKVLNGFPQIRQAYELHRVDTRRVCEHAAPVNGRDCLIGAKQNLVCATLQHSTSRVGGIFAHVLEPRSPSGHQSSWGAEDTPSDDGKVEEMMCEELEEAYKAPTLKDLASALSGGSNLQNAPGWD